MLKTLGSPRVFLLVVHRLGPTTILQWIRQFVGFCSLPSPEKLTKTAISTLPPPDLAIGTYFDER